LGFATGHYLTDFGYRAAGVSSILWIKLSAAVQPLCCYKAIGSRKIVNHTKVRLRRDAFCPEQRHPVVGPRAARAASGRAPAMAGRTPRTDRRRDRRRPRTARNWLAPFLRR